MDLSIFSVGGLTQPNTMKLQGKVKGKNNASDKNPSSLETFDEEDWNQEKDLIRL